MAQVLNAHPPYGTLPRPSSSSSPKQPSLSTLHTFRDALLVRNPNPKLNPNPNHRWTTLQEGLRCDGRYLCFFEDGRKQEQARKALESALGGKKTEFEKWNKEIEKREGTGGGGTSGRGGWFGGGGWFGWFNGEHFWEEAQQASLAVIGIVSLYLLITKGNVMFAVIFNSLLFVLRGTRNWFTFVLSRLSGKTTPATPIPERMSDASKTRISAKESVVRKWGMD